jgi:hypothetical protein
MVCEGQITYTSSMPFDVRGTVDRFGNPIRAITLTAALSLIVAGFTACGGGSSSNNSPPTAPPTATPMPSTVSVATSPSPFVLSKSGAGGVARSGTVVATQSNTTGGLSFSTTSSPPCYNASMPSLSDLVEPENPAFSFVLGTAQLGFTLVAQNTGTCMMTITPATGTPVNFAVTIGS